MVCTMLATAISGDASRGRLAEKIPSGTPRATAIVVEPATSSTCWPNKWASSARCDSQNANRPLTSRSGDGWDRVQQSPDVRIGGRGHDGGAVDGDQAAVLQDAD